MVSNWIIINYRFGIFFICLIRKGLCLFGGSEGLDRFSGVAVFCVPKLYPIIDRATLDARGVPVAAFAAELATAGVGMVQYRDKLRGPQELLRAAEQIAAAFAERECVFVMNDRADLAALLGWGVHVGQGDLSVEDARKVLRTPHLTLPLDEAERRGWGTQLVGVSTHTEEQLRAACEPTSQMRDVGHPDYVAIGPVFATRSKADAEPVVGLEGVRRARALTRRLPEERALVAIGGITLENARSSVDAGADSVAVISGLFVEGRSVADVARDFLRVLG